MTALQTEDWKIEKRGKGCHSCSRKFDSEEVFYSGIAEIPAQQAKAQQEQPEGSALRAKAPTKKPKKDSDPEPQSRFERRDYCVPCWEKKPELFSFWKTRMERKEEKRLEDINAMQEFFRRLIAGSLEDPARAKVAYLTALLLSRKRRIRLAGSTGGMLKIEKTWDGETITIPEPVITDEELGDLRTRMEALFELELGTGDLEKPDKQG